jgi:hypothetical protein
MVRRRSPVVEGLEDRALLSSLSYSLTTNQSVYQVGQPIEMTFTETNTSNQPVTVPSGVPEGFGVTHDGTPVSSTRFRIVLAQPRRRFSPARRSRFRRRGTESRCSDRTRWPS